MKFLATLACAALVAFVLPACSTAPKKQTDSCCAEKGSCDAPAKKHR